MTYRIYYGDGTTADDDPTEARGVQAIVQGVGTVGAEIVTTGDYYVLRDDRWCPVDFCGLLDFLMDSGIVLMGRTIRREEYYAVVHEAMAYKETWRPGERKFV